MLRDLPPLKSLRVFEACMRLGSFSRAAKELNVGQPAISHQIHALEQDLGTKLFERRGGRAVPTANALTYCRVIAGALADMAQASVNLRRSARSPSLRLATYPGIAMFWLMPRLARLRKEHPSLTLRVTTVERDQDIPFEDIDCAILFGGGAWPDYESHRLIKEAVVPIASPAVAANAALRVPARLLEHGPLIHLEDKDNRWFTWADWRSRRSPGTERIDPGITVTNHGIAIHQALIGQGVALGWMGVIDELIRNKLLVALDATPLTSERGYYLVGRGDFLQSDTGTLLLNALHR